MTYFAFRPGEMGMVEDDLVRGALAGQALVVEVGLVVGEATGGAAHGGVA